MIRQGDRIVVGVSGGVDSLGLLFVLRELQTDFGLSIFVVHVNHRMRREAKGDEMFVAKLCERLELPLTVREFDIPALAREMNRGLEETGRIMRRRALQDAKESYHADRIALAHHGDDQTETILLHLFRGAGGNGLSGMRYVQDDYIRPFLSCTKEDIRNYVESLGETWREDITNSLDVYRRNYIRNRLLPEIQKEINAQAPRHIREAGERVGELLSFAEQACDKIYPQCVKEKKSSRKIRKKVFDKLDPLLQKMVLSRAMTEVCGRAENFQSVHIGMLLSLMAGQVSREVSLPHGLIAARDYDGLTLSLRAAKEEKAEKTGGLTSGGLAGFFFGEAATPRFAAARDAKGGSALDGAERFDAVPGQIEVKKIELGKGDRYKKYTKEKTYTKYFDYDIIKGSLSLRYRLPGDAIVIDDKGSHKKVADYFKEEKIPRENRGMIPLLADEEEVLWIIGYRMNMAYQVTKETKTVLRVKYIKA